MVWGLEEGSELASKLGSEFATFTIPAWATEIDRKVLVWFGLEADRRLVGRHSVTFALYRIAGGRDEIKELLDDLGYVYDRKTIAKSLARLSGPGGPLEKVGQLSGWWDGDLPKRGAFVYALRVRIKRVGELVTAAMGRLTATSPPSATFRGISPGSRAQACLQGAIKHAIHGTRNVLGHWLACRLRDMRLPFTEAETVMDRYRGSVTSLGPAYTHSEARRTLQSVYRKVA
jgi:hypothetical protein